MHIFFETVGILTCFSFSAMLTMIAVQTLAHHYRKKHLPVYHEVKIELDEFEEVLYYKN
jgi:hypothetical protein